MFEGLDINKDSTSYEDKFEVISKLFKENRVGIGILDADNFSIINANSKFLSFFNPPFNELDNVLGLCLNEISDEFSEFEKNEKWQEILKLGKTSHMREIKGATANCADTYWDNTFIPITENGKIRYIISMLNDVTERVTDRIFIEQQKKTIMWQKEQLEAIIENMSDSLAIIDPDGGYVFFSKPIADFSLDSGNIIRLEDLNKKYTFLNSDWEVITKEMLPFTRILRGEKISHMRIAVKQGGLIHYLNISGSPVFDKDGELLMGIMCVWDVTEQVKYQEILNAQRDIQLLIEKEKQEELEKIIRMKDEFLYTISHEFKTPLTVINAALQAMECICRDEISNKAKGFIAKIRQNNLRQLRLVNNLLDITKANAGQIKINLQNHDIVFITKSITESVKLFAQQKAISLTFASKAAKKIIGIDEEKYERILLNLLSNAIKFSPKGSGISIKIESKRNCVFVYVKDEGIGIPKDKQGVIFERFGQVDSSFTRQAEGTGIGLSLVKLLVEAIGGSISVRSKPGKGSTFIVSLPAQKVNNIEKNRLKKYENELDNRLDNRLINSLAIEFSDIYVS